MTTLAPEEIELNKKRRVLERLKDRLATSEEEMADLRGLQEQFEAQYTMGVAQLYAEFDDIEAQIAEEGGKARPRRRRNKEKGRGNAPPRRRICRPSRRRHRSGQFSLQTDACGKKRPITTSPASYIRTSLSTPVKSSGVMA